MSKTSSAAKRRYNAKAYDRIEIWVKAGRKAVIKEAAAQAGMSVNAYITAAIDKMEK